MLNFKSVLSGFVVCLLATDCIPGTCVCQGDDDLLLDFPTPVRTTDTGDEKCCDDDLLSPGVSFPTRFYARHSFAYSSRMVLVEVVSCSNPIFGPVLGDEKACGDELLAHGVSFPTQRYGSHSGAYGSRLVRVQAVDFPHLQSWGKIRQMDSTVLDVAEMEIEPKGIETAMLGDFSGIEQGSAANYRVWRAASGFGAVDQESSVEELDRFTGFEVPAREMRKDGNLQAVGYWSLFGKGTLASGAEETFEAYDEVGASNMPPETKDGGLFRCLGDVELKNAVLTDSDLPDKDNSAREHFRKVGVQRHWSSGSWVSFRPGRNTFPFHHNPLYFEDPNLERCGQSCGFLTEVTSIAHFAGRIPILPYMMTVEPPCSLVKSKPDCPTCSSFGPDAYVPHPDEIHLGGAAVQAAMTVGLIFLIP